MVSRAVLTVSGIRSDGYRELLGVRIGDTESFATWDETFRWLRGRGLKGTMFIILQGFLCVQRQILIPPIGSSPPAINICYLSMY